MSFPAPDITDLDRPFWDGLQHGRLMYQHCAKCGNNWLPPRAACPECLAPSPEWQHSVGEAEVVSWVTYHKAYIDYFKDKVPYDVTIVRLAEGPQLLTNVVNSQAGKLLQTGQRVVLTIETEDGTALAKFRIPEPEDEHE